MKNFGLIVLSTIVVMASGFSFADETIPEKASAGLNSAKRRAKKGAHRVSEAVCGKGKIACTGEKIGNRAEEIKDATVDGVKKVSNKID